MINTQIAAARQQGARYAETAATKWVVAPNHDKGYSRITTEECIRKGYSDTIAQDVKDEDAARICNAVNSHDVLAAENAVLRAALTELYDVALYQHTGTGRDEALTQARAALDYREDVFADPAPPQADATPAEQPAPPSSAQQIEAVLGNIEVLTDGEELEPPRNPYGCDNRFCGCVDTANQIIAELVAAIRAAAAVPPDATAAAVHDALRAALGGSNG